MARPIGIVVALRLEAAALPQWPRRWRAEALPTESSPGIWSYDAPGAQDRKLYCALSGPGAPAAERTARLLLRRDLGGIVSFGVSGGLDPALAPGALLLGQSVLAESGSTLPTDPTWSRNAATLLEAHITPVTHSPLWCAERPLLSAQDKANSFATTKCGAVDMESCGVAEAAARAEAPFITLRAVCDPAGRDVSPELFDCLDPHGGVRAGPLARLAARRPWALLELGAMGRDFGRAVRSLRTAAKVLAEEGFGLDA